MMNSDIEKALAQSFEDYRLSKSEKFGFKEVFGKLADTPEVLSFARNKAFDLVTTHMRESSENHVACVKWLEGIAKLLDSARSKDEKSEISAHFSPGKSCVTRIVTLIKNARHSIDVCVFTISDDRISDALLSAHESGIKLRIITDDDKASGMGSDVNRLAKKGVAVKTDDSPSHMHHKYSIFDGTTLVNGSFNWTRSASTNNQENILVMNDSRCVTPFKENFEKLWQKCIWRTAKRS